MKPLIPILNSISYVEFITTKGNIRVKINQFQLASTLFLMMSQAFAGNPVLHFLDKPFPTKISTLGGSATSTYIFTNNLPFAFKKPFQVFPILCPTPNQECTATGVDFQYNDQCTGKKLQPRESCTYSIDLNSR